MNAIEPILFDIKDGTLKRVSKSNFNIANSRLEHRSLTESGQVSSLLYRNKENNVTAKFNSPDSISQQYRADKSVASGEGGDDDDDEDDQNDEMDEAGEADDEMLEEVKENDEVNSSDRKVIAASESSASLNNSQRAASSSSS